MSDLSVSLDHCVIHVSGWEVAKDFYTRVMGGEAVPVTDGHVFRWGDKQLNCHGPNKFAEPKVRIPVESGNSDLCFNWQGPIADAVSHLQGQWIDIELGAKAPELIYFRDPDGSLMEFISYDR